MGVARRVRGVPRRRRAWSSRRRRLPDDVPRRRVPLHRAARQLRADGRADRARLDPQGARPAAQDGRAGQDPGRDRPRPPALHGRRRPRREDPAARCSRTCSPAAAGSTTSSTTRPSRGPTRSPSPTSSTPAALISQQAVFKNCSYGPYKRILRRIIAEEGFHMRHGEEMLLTFAEGTPSPARHVPGGARPLVVADAAHVRPAVEARRPLLRWHIKTERNEDLRDKFVQKYATLLTGYGFGRPTPTCAAIETRAVGDRRDRLGAAARRRCDNLGPDSARRIGDAARHWEDTRWVRDALEAVSRRATRRDATRRSSATRCRRRRRRPRVPRRVDRRPRPRRTGRPPTDGRVEVDLVPTFSGCPALELIAADVRGALVGARGRRRRRAVRRDTGVDAGADQPAGAPPAGRRARGRRRRRRPVRRAVHAAAQTRSIEESMFGPVRCRSIHRCRACGEVVETIR